MTGPIRKKYNIIDLFAGVGGLSYGFAAIDRFRIIAANEIEKDIATAYSLNHPNVKMLNRDIGQLTAEMLESVLEGQEIDLVVVLFHPWKAQARQEG